MVPAPTAVAAAIVGAETAIPMDPLPMADSIVWFGPTPLLLSAKDRTCDKLARRETLISSDERLARNSSGDNVPPPPPSRAPFNVCNCSLVAGNS